MAATPPLPTVRNQNLQTLLTSVQQWAQQEQQRLDNENLFLQAVMQGRNAPACGVANLSTASALLQASINDFINIT